MAAAPQIVPLTIVSGFLGSGKTSLLNHLLTEADGRRVTALVNDFGALNIDAELIAARHGNQIALANGCVCCSIGDDLMRSFLEIMQTLPLPDHIIVEASGVADPTRIAGFAAVDRHLRLDGIVTLVDATAHKLHGDDPHLADNYAKQISAANLLLISKADVAGEAEAAALEARLHEIAPDIPTARATHGRVPIDIVLGLNANENQPPRPAPAPQDNAHDFVTWSAHLPALPRAEVQQKLESLRPHVLRAKGILQDADGAYVLHLAGGRITIEAHPTEPSGHFVIIGKPQMQNAAALARLFNINEAA